MVKTRGGITRNRKTGCNALRQTCCVREVWQNENELTLTQWSILDALLEPASSLASKYIQIYNQTKRN